MTSFGSHPARAALLVSAHALATPSPGPGDAALYRTRHPPPEDVRRLLRALFYKVPPTSEPIFFFAPKPLPLSRLSDRRRPTNARDGQCSLPLPHRPRTKSHLDQTGCGSSSVLRNGGTSVRHFPRPPSPHAAFHTCPRATAPRAQARKTATIHARHADTPRIQSHARGHAHRSENYCLHSSPTHRHAARPHYDRPRASHLLL